MNDSEKQTAAALEAVRRAAVVCRSVQAKLVDASTLEKKDKSPVTVADFASQAIVCAVLERQFGADAVVGEEDSKELRAPENSGLLAEVVAQVGTGLGESVEESRVLDWIDRGGADASSGRYWTLDPIDGTKGFLRGEQYAIALALLEEGEVVFGALGCPNLDDGAGALLAATRQGGTSAFDLWDHSQQAGTTVRVADITTTAAARFCESVESAHSDHSESAQIAERLGITKEPFRIDSQCKYACVARGDASIYLRMPTGADYREKIWDHAAGMLVVEAAGGTVTDVNGEALDFSLGRTLENNRGIIATCGPIHHKVLEAVTAVRNQSQEIFA